MANAFAMFKLIPAIQIVYRFGVEFTKNDFQELTEEQYDAYRRKVSTKEGRIFRIVLVEPKAIARTPEKVTYELEIVTEFEKELLLEAVRFIRQSSKALDKGKPTFKKRLNYLRTIWPPAITGGG